MTLTPIGIDSIVAPNTLTAGRVAPRIGAPVLAVFLSLTLRLPVRTRRDGASGSGSLLC